MKMIMWMIVGIMRGMRWRLTIMRGFRVLLQVSSSSSSRRRRRRRMS